jgi:hypothetical protein
MISVAAGWSVSFGSVGGMVARSFIVRNKGSCGLSCGSGWWWSRCPSDMSCNMMVKSSFYTLVIFGTYSLDWEDLIVVRLRVSVPQLRC